MRGLLTLTALCILASACNTNGCLDNQNAIPKAAFYLAGTDQSISLDILQIHGVGVPNDSILVKAGTAVSEVYLPMRSEYDVTQWCFHYTDESLSEPSMNDTITFRYTSTPYFVSEECGASYRYFITEYTTTKHVIDSVAVTDSLITNVDRVRIEIYFGASEPEPGPGTEQEL